MDGGKETLRPGEKELCCELLLFLEQFEGAVLKVRNIVGN